MESQEINLIGFMMEQALATMSTSLAINLKAEGIDLPHSQYAVMRLIYSSTEPISQVKISEILKKDAAAIKRTLDILERKGYIIREAHDGRTNVISCTPLALAQKNRIIDTANNTLHQLFCDFNRQDISSLYQMLSKLAQHKK